MIYLDNAATSFPKPPRVPEQLRAFLETFGACPGRGSYEMARRAQALVEETRGLLAALFHVAEPQRMIFTLNATDALNMAIKGRRGARRPCGDDRGGAQLGQPAARPDGAQGAHPGHARRGVPGRGA